VRKRLAHSQQALAFAGLKRLALSAPQVNDLKAGLLSFNFKLLDGRAVDHSENKGPSAGRGQVPRCSNRTEPEATTHAVPRRRRRFDLKSVHPARPRASGLFVAVCVGGLKVLLRARRMRAAWSPRSSFFRSFLAVLQLTLPEICLNPKICGQALLTDFSERRTCPLLDAFRRLGLSRTWAPVCWDRRRRAF
jgi:hypothetical protein